jgi:uncharacterized protein (TIGR03067 family)
MFYFTSRFTEWVFPTEDTMRITFALAVVLVAFSGSRADEKTAPGSKDKTPPSIEGIYTLVLISDSDGSTVPGGAPAPKGPAPKGPAPKGGGGGGRGAPAPKGIGAGPGARVTTSTVLSAATITKNEITIEGRITPGSLGGQTSMEYTLDPTKTPMAIDVETVDRRGKKSKALGIVVVSGNRLIVAVANVGDERPTTIDHAEGVTVYYFQKAPPPPRTEFRIVAMTVGKEEAVEKELNKLSQEGYELVTTTQPLAIDGTSMATTIHFLLRRTVSP